MTQGEGQQKQPQQQIARLPLGEFIKAEFCGGTQYPEQAWQVRHVAVDSGCRSCKDIT